MENAMARNAPSGDFGSSPDRCFHCRLDRYALPPAVA
jgi:hypothetical protein